MSMCNFRLKKRSADNLFAIGLIAPLFILLGFLIIYPICSAIAFSLTDLSLLRPTVKWVGPANFSYLIHNRVFWEVLGNTVLLSFVPVIFQVLIGLFLAILLNEKVIRGRYIFRGIIFLNWVLPWIVVALLWMWMFNEEYGIINYVLRTMRVIKEFLPWLGKPTLARIALIITNIWRGIPFMMLMFLAGLQAIPKDVDEAATVDGAGRIERFLTITLPFLRPIIMIASLLSIMRMFNNFQLIWIMTQGGPLYSTTTFPIFTYQLAFGELSLAKGSAVGVIWLGFLLLFSLFYVRLGKGVY